ncbi:hypothetical protein [Pseudomonas sp. KK4]|uniref:hypothetical protein n=1 Tax=Pseudomonas sp. KK4 TaxID=1855729 RepID=UPI00097BB41D|nr:hypothetical protein [Pseudomonas sp. KK4]
MPDDNHANIVIADTLTLLLHNQHALGAAIEELASWVRVNGSPTAHANVITALQTLDTNASAITAGILKLRQ